MTYSVNGLAVEPFKPFFGLSAEKLAQEGIVRVTADAPVGYPCRVLLEDAKPGDTLLLLNHEYQSANTPYRGRHAIFVNEAAAAPGGFVDAIPPVLSIRKAISLRAFDAAGMMIEAEMVTGAEVEACVLKLLADNRASYLHAHNAARGCFAARIDRN